ncbi:hypothetical protein G6F23_013202 [Rhizopus arrhizus]|nr:hypothetical protein G6F23_013202 [Rhizopus arrhizus]
MQGTAGLDHVTQGAVHPVAHHRMGLERFDVQVAGAIACGLRQQCVDHADHRRVVLRVQQIGDFRHVLHQAVQIHFTFSGTDHRCGIAAVTILLTQPLLPRCGFQCLERQRAVPAAQFGHRPGGGFGSAQQYRLTAGLGQHHAMAAHPGIRQRHGYAHGPITSSGV